MAETTAGSMPKKGRASTNRTEEKKQYSEQTEAIIDRLKREGQLLRNSGKNSIRQTNIELEKFSGAFDSISDAISEQSSILNGMQDLAADQAEDAKRRADLAELNDGESETAKEIRLLREKTDLYNAKKELKEAKGPGLLDGLFSGSMLKNLAIVAGGGFIAFKVIKGFVNEMTDGGFDRFLEEVKNFDFAAVGQALSDFGTAAVEFVGAAGPAMESLITYFDDPVKLLTGLAASAVGAKLITSIGTSIAAKAIGNLVTGMPGAMSGKAGKGMGKAMMGALGVAGLIYAEDIASYIRGSARNADIKNFDLTESATSVGIATAGGATIGMMFGPKGALVGAIAGLAYGLGKEIYDYVQDDVLDKGLMTNRGEELTAQMREQERALAALTEEQYAAWVEAQGENFLTLQEFGQGMFEEAIGLDAKIKELERQKAAVPVMVQDRMYNSVTGEYEDFGMRAKTAEELERDIGKIQDDIDLYTGQRDLTISMLNKRGIFDQRTTANRLGEVGAALGADGATPLTPPSDAVINQMPEDMAEKIETAASVSSSQVQVTVAKGGDSTVINNTTVKGGATQTFTSVNSSGAPVQQDVFGPMQ